MARKSKNNPAAVLIISTVANQKEATHLSDALIKARIAACVTFIASVRSTYVWKGKLERSREGLLLIKTARQCYSRVEKKIQELHSYEIPEIICLPIEKGSASYLSWLKDSLSR